MPDSAISTRGLTKVFETKKEKGWRSWFPGAPKAKLTAVDHVDLDIPRGQLFGLLGPNGAGKTTLVKLLSTLLLPTEGSATILGLDVVKDEQEIRKKVGVVLGGERALYWRLTARENLWYFSQLHNMPGPEARERIAHLLELVGLTARADERVENYSKGMKQRLHIARGLLTDPEILLLDEPTIGLDPHAARTLRTLVRDLVVKHDRTVVLTTHYMYEADELSDRVAILHKGHVLTTDSPAALKSRYASDGGYRVTVRGAPNDKLRASLAALDGVAAVVAKDEGARTSYRVVPRDASADAAASAGPIKNAAAAASSRGEHAADGLAGPLARVVAGSGAELVALVREEPTLEDVFVRITGESVGD
ncbi:MAG: ABC transporter ATP-binding protein [Thermoplasmatota archaeon]